MEQDVAVARDVVDLNVVVLGVVDLVDAVAHLDGSGPDVATKEVIKIDLITIRAHKNTVLNEKHMLKMKFQHLFGQSYLSLLLLHM